MFQSPLIFMILVSVGLLMGCSDSGKSAGPDVGPSIYDKVPGKPTLTPFVKAGEENTIPANSRYSTQVKEIIERLNLIPLYPLERNRPFQGKQCQTTDCRNKYVSITSNSMLGTIECSGVSLTKKLILTNYHCIKPSFNPDDKHFPLKDEMFVHVPSVSGQNGRAYEVLRVVAHVPIPFFEKEILGHQYSMDYAILELRNELKNVVSPTLNYDYGIRNGETYKIMQLSPFQSGNQNIVSEYECKAIFNSTVAPAVKAGDFPIGYFTNCPIGPENSGSPIYNLNGELVGIIAGQMNPGTLFTLTEEAMKIGILDKPLQYIGYGTMLTCIPKIENGILTSQVGATCDRNLFNIKVDNQVTLTDSVLQKLFHILSQDLMSNEIFSLQPQTLQTQRVLISDMLLGGTMVAMPECVKRSGLGKLKNQYNITLPAASALLNEYSLFDENVMKLTNGFSVNLVFEDVTKISQSTKVKIFDGSYLPHDATAEMKYVAGRLLREIDIKVCQ